MILPDGIWNSPVIRRRLFAEACFESNHGVSQKQHYWFMVPQGDTKRGNLVLQNFDETIMAVPPHEMQQEFARKLQKNLQRELSHDGLWMVGWTHPPIGWDTIRTDGDNCWLRLVMIWLDEDADPHYTVESDFPFIKMVQNGDQYYTQLAAQAHAAWDEDYGKRALKEDFGLEEDDSRKEALETLN